MTEIKITKINVEDNVEEFEHLLHDLHIGLNSYKTKNPGYSYDISYNYEDLEITVKSLDLGIHAN